MRGFAAGAENCLPVIFSCEGETLSSAEYSFFSQANPLGFILFARNCQKPDQLKTLVSDLKECVGRDCPILIDQEGGRVQRLAPPQWRRYPTMKSYGDKYYEQGPELATQDMQLGILQLCEDLTDAGINVNCAPVADVLQPETHDVIGDRAFSDDLRVVSALSLTACQTYLSAGITPIIKHIPGHGRAKTDSHEELPHVEAGLADLEKDFEPFRNVSMSSIRNHVWAMTAHICYHALDKDLPASLSSKVLRKTIREEIGFHGIILSDDLDMKALSDFGAVEDLAVKTVEAGCDLALYCAGQLPIMQKIAEKLPKISKNTLERLQKADYSDYLAA